MNFWIIFTAVATAEVALFFLRVVAKMIIVCWREVKAKKEEIRKAKEIATNSIYGLTHAKFAQPVPDTRELQRKAEALERKHDKGNTVELISCVIDIFEDFLEEKGINIPNPEKEETEHAAIIYGTDFGELYDQLEREFRCNGWIE